MAFGYKEFEFDLPGALLVRLIDELDSLEPAPLSQLTSFEVPNEQGVYQLFLSVNSGCDLVYIGKTDAESGLGSRLERHARKVQNRQNLDPLNIYFKAVRVFVFTAVDLETGLIQHYSRSSPVAWNGSGFGSNDPGRERDTTAYKPEHFDTRYPIDIQRPLNFTLPESGSAALYLNSLKSQLPYLIRFERPSKGSRLAHPDLESTTIEIDSNVPNSPETVIRQIIKHLPTGWHATMLPSHIIIYKNDSRRFPSGRLIARS